MPSRKTSKLSSFKPIIFGCAGTRLSREEKIFFATHRPIGFIIFSRNIENPKQLKALVSSVKRVSKNPHLLVLIDQEGGRVARLKEPHWRHPAPALQYGRMAQRNKAAAMEAVYLNHVLIAKELRALGINVDCAPLVDLLFEGSDAIIGDRAFGADPTLVATLGRAASNGLLAGGVLPIIKHIPGHGRATADSHKALPIVKTSLRELKESDFISFKKLRDIPFAMTAHIQYDAIDNTQPATFSKKVIGHIRRTIGFKGLIMTDDLSMHALTGTFSERAKRSLRSGCDILLHCNGKMKEMVAIAEATPQANASLVASIKRVLTKTRASRIDTKNLLKKHDALLKAYQV